MALLMLASLILPIQSGTAIAQSDCADVLIIGARGSGQTDNDGKGFGTQVLTLVDLISDQLPKNLSVERHAVSYPSHGVELVAKGQLFQYLEGVDIGVDAMIDRTRTAIRDCAGRQTVILAGYSQGALVVHNTLFSLAEHERDIIGAAVLLSDPAREGGKPENRGNAPEDRDGIYQLVSKSHPRIPAEISRRVFSFCIAGDIVCDYTLGNAASTSIHTDQYQLTSAKRAAVAASRALVPRCEGKTVTIARLFESSPARLNGTDGPDVIAGSEHRDVIRGRGGNDTICAKGGNDDIYGNGGSDRILAGSGADRVWAGSGNDIVRGGRGNDQILGGDGRDTLRGEGGRDLVKGQNGHDPLVHGGSARDRIEGGSGNDVLDGGPGVDNCLDGLGNDRRRNCEKTVDVPALPSSVSAFAAGACYEVEHIDSSSAMYCDVWLRITTTARYAYSDPVMQPFVCDRGRTPLLSTPSDPAAATWGCVLYGERRPSTYHGRATMPSQPGEVSTAIGLRTETPICVYVTTWVPDGTGRGSVLTNSGFIGPTCLRLSNTGELSTIP